MKYTGRKQRTLINVHPFRRYNCGILWVASSFGGRFRRRLRRRREDAVNGLQAVLIADTGIF